MLVRDVMSAPVESLNANATCAEALAFLRSRGLRRAPLVDGKRLVGMLTERDLAAIATPTVADINAGRDKRAQNTPALSLATTELCTIVPNDHIERAAATMLRAKVGALPVVEANGELVGILTESDIFRLFVRRTLDISGHRLILRAPHNRIDELDPAALCVAHNAQLLDLGLFPLDGGRVSCILRVRTSALEALLDAFQSTGYELVLVEND